MDRLTKIENKFKKEGIKCTRQRTAIIELLLELNQPLSAADIYNHIKKKLPKLRLSTIYRNLNYFESINLVNRLDINNKESMFELLGKKHHHHLICLDCGEIQALNCPLKNYKKKLQIKTNYTIVEHKMKMYGYCPSCQENN